MPPKRASTSDMASFRAMLPPGYGSVDNIKPTTITSHVSNLRRVWIRYEPPEPPADAKGKRARRQPAKPAVPPNFDWLNDTEGVLTAIKAATLNTRDGLQSEIALIGSMAGVCRELKMQEARERFLALVDSRKKDLNSRDRKTEDELWRTDANFVPWRYLLAYTRETLMPEFERAYTALVTEQKPMTSQLKTAVMQGTIAALVVLQPCTRRAYADVRVLTESAPAPANKSYVRVPESGPPVFHAVEFKTADSMGEQRIALEPRPTLGFTDDVGAILRRSLQAFPRTVVIPKPTDPTRGDPAAFERLLQQAFRGAGFRLENGKAKSVTATAIRKCQATHLHARWAGLTDERKRVQDLAKLMLHSPAMAMQAYKMAQRRADDRDVTNNSVGNNNAPPPPPRRTRTQARRAEEEAADDDEVQGREAPVMDEEDEQQDEAPEQPTGAAQALLPANIVTRSDGARVRVPLPNNGYAHDYYQRNADSLRQYAKVRYHGPEHDHILAKRYAREYNVRAVTPFDSVRRRSRILQYLKYVNGVWVVDMSSFGA